MLWSTHAQTTTLFPLTTSLPRYVQTLTVGLRATQRTVSDISVCRTQTLQLTTRKNCRHFCYFSQKEVLRATQLATSTGSHRVFGSRFSYLYPVIHSYLAICCHTTYLSTHLFCLNLPLLHTAKYKHTVKSSNKSRIDHIQLQLQYKAKATIKNEHKQV